MASTVAGQRRILKRPGSVLNYIKRAVECGVYRSPEELTALRKERATNGTDDLRVIMSRFRQDIVRGSFVHDYPTEYFILEQHPPIPDPPRTPVRLRKQLLRPPIHAVERLTKKYLNRQEQQQHQQKGTHSNNNNNNGPSSTEDYYRRLLGVQAAASGSQQQQHQQEPYHVHLRHKPASLQRAYAAAVTHYQIQRNSSSGDGNMSDAEAMRQVDALLAQQAMDEQAHSRQQREAVVEAQKEKLRRASKNTPTPTPSPTPVPSTLEDMRLDPTTNAAEYPFMQKGFSSSNSNNNTSSRNWDGSPLFSDPPPPPHPTTATSTTPATAAALFTDSPRTVQAMMHWSERLAAVPYMEWTIGASTALDHWIARQVLQVSEETWQTALQGDDPDILAIGRDIVACREALFPETILKREQAEAMRASLAAEEYEASVAADDDDAEEEAASGNLDEDEGGFAFPKETKSIEELLQKLGGLRGPDSRNTKSSSPLAPQDDWSFLARADTDAELAASTATSAIDMDETDLDAKVERLVNELQSWRRRNQEKPYENWTRTDQDRFLAWMKGYIQTVSSGAERNRRVDYDSTRVALLSGQPPVSADESDAFWSQLQDQGTATALLDAMVEDGPPPGASLLHSAFWDLPRNEQLPRLLNLGALRPLLDEYTKESDRLRFLQRHGDTILSGTPLEHLVADPAGPVHTKDLHPDVVLALGIPEGARFRLELIPYKSGGSGDTNNSSASSSSSEESSLSSSPMELSRAIFMAWNEHKAGRARYEEKMFLTGRLGLRYNEKNPKKD